MSADPEQQVSSDFETESQKDRISLAAEFWDFLKHNKKWWLLPIVIILLLVSLLVVLPQSLAPFIYPLF